MSRHAKELDLGLSAADRALNRSGKLTPEQASSLRNVGVARIRLMARLLPIGAVAAVGMVVVKSIADGEGDSLDITVFYALGIVFVVLGLVVSIFAGPLIWFAYFRGAKRAVIVPWHGKAHLGARTSEGTNVRIGPKGKEYRWRIPNDVADTVVDGADYTVYRNHDVLHWFELSE